MYRLVVEIDYNKNQFSRFALDKNKVYGTPTDAINAAEDYFDLGMSKIRIAKIVKKTPFRETWTVYDENEFVLEYVAGSN
jgi:hypothetical protein